MLTAKQARNLFAYISTEEVLDHIRKVAPDRSQTDMDSTRITKETIEDLRFLGYKVRHILDQTIRILW